MAPLGDRDRDRLDWTRLDEVCGSSRWSTESSGEREGEQGGNRACVSAGVSAPSQSDAQNVLYCIVLCVVIYSDETGLISPHQTSDKQKITITIRNVCFSLILLLIFHI